MTAVLCVDCETFFLVDDDVHGDDRYCPHCKVCTSRTSLYDTNGTLKGAFERHAETFGMKRSWRLYFVVDGVRRRFRDVSPQEWK